MFWKSTTSDAVAANELECSVSFCMHRINLLDLNSLWIYYEISLSSPPLRGTSSKGLVDWGLDE